jgi:hypothetical protein
VKLLRAQLRDVAERQREACAEQGWDASGWCGNSIRDHIRVTPLVTEKEPT